MSALVDHAIEAAGLSVVLAARRAGAVGASADSIRDADLLALGALADRVRREEVGDEVRIYALPSEPPATDVIVLPREDRNLTGLELLREVALARVTGPHAARVRVDWARCGLELAQVALGFGASELAGNIANKRGLPIAEGELAGVGKKSRLQLAHVIKKKEIAGFVRRAGRIPLFVGLDGSVEVVDHSLSIQEPAC
ncbi:MAG: hypothetical protein M3O46_09205 [Myxococcota bacterium]|nr:hypothetical protein [Myxococcota bacterium]